MNTDQSESNIVVIFFVFSHFLLYLCQSSSPLTRTSNVREKSRRIFLRGPRYSSALHWLGLHHSAPGLPNGVTTLLRE